MHSIKYLLANSCPYINGNGVFKARLLSLSLQPSKIYDDIGICNYAGVYRTSEDPLQAEEDLINGKNKKLLIENSIKVFPNPTTGQITVEYILNKAEKGEVIIYNIQGIAMQTLELNTKAKRITTTLNFIPGIYFAKIIVDNKLIETHKLIVE